jgi:hypothetical protein
MPYRTNSLTALAAVAIVLAIQTPALADTTLVDQTLPGPIGGAQLCVAGACLPPVDGVRNVRVRVVARGTGIVPPLVVPGSAPGCTANVNLALRVLTPGIGLTPHATLSFDRSDRNGAVVPGSHQVVEGDVPVSLSTIGIPVASICAAVLG